MPSRGPKCLKIYYSRLEDRALTKELVVFLGSSPRGQVPGPGQHHRQPTPDNAGRTAAETTVNQQNKPGIQPATTPRTETGTHRHSTPHQGGGHAQTRHAPTAEGAHTSTTPTPAKPTTQPRPQPTKQMTTPQTTHHDRGGQAPTRHALPGGGARTNAARPTTRGATNQRSTPHHGGGAHTDTARPTMRGARTNTARPMKRGTTNQRSTPHHGGGHTPTQHAPP